MQQQRIAQDGVLRIGMIRRFPFEEFAFDTVQGIDVDLAQALAAELGLTTEFVFLGYDGLYDGLAVGRMMCCFPASCPICAARRILPSVSRILMPDWC